MTELEGRQALAIQTAVRSLKEIVHDASCEAGYWGVKHDDVIAIRLKQLSRRMLDMSNTQPALREGRQYAAHVIALLDLAAAADADIEDVFVEVLRQIRRRKKLKFNLRR